MKSSGHKFVMFISVKLGDSNNVTTLTARVTFARWFSKDENRRLKRLDDVGLVISNRRRSPVLMIEQGLNKILRKELLRKADVDKCE